jgi:hypothetical protein
MISNQYEVLAIKKKKKKIVHMRLKRWLPFWNVDYVYEGENDFYFRKEHVIKKKKYISQNNNKKIYQYIY